ncbi:hypothetical protein GYMLUDRAFT_114166, partial [Collybiopsis luxurians FD-317 M1]
GFKGNIIIIIFPQQPEPVAKMLPPSVDELLSPICIMFVGSSKPTPDWIRKHAKSLSVRPAKVQSALVWLKKHKTLYKNIDINDGLLDSLPPNFVLLAHIEYMTSNLSSDGLTSGYGPVQDGTSSSDILEKEIPFESVVITYVDGNGTSNELRAAAVRHLKRNGSYVQLPHDPTPVNEFFNPVLFPMIYPTLFLYGIGGLEDYKRTVTVSLKCHGKHLL